MLRRPNDARVGSFDAWLLHHDDEDAPRIEDRSPAAHGSGAGADRPNDRTALAAAAGHLPVSRPQPHRCSKPDTTPPTEATIDREDDLHQPSSIDFYMFEGLRVLADGNLFIDHNAVIHGTADGSVVVEGIRRRVVPTAPRRRRYAVPPWIAVWDDIPTHPAEHLY
jgi:hypothetical protein